VAADEASARCVRKRRELVERRGVDAFADVDDVSERGSVRDRSAYARRCRAGWNRDRRAYDVDRGRDDVVVRGVDRARQGAVTLAGWCGDEEGGRSRDERLGLAVFVHFASDVSARRKLEPLFGVDHLRVARLAGRNRPLVVILIELGRRPIALVEQVEKTV